MRCGESKAGGFSVAELTLAIGIAAFCLVAIFGLVPVGVQTNRNATSQMTATSLIAAVVADLRATPKGTQTSSQFAITFGTDQTLYFDSAGQASTSLGANSRYRLKVTWSGSAELRYADLKATWPAPVDPATTPPSGSVEIFAAFDRS
jgi:uncharacterized protein (TIGR02598 family)